MTTIEESYSSEILTQTDESAQFSSINNQDHQQVILERVKKYIPYIEKALSDVNSTQIDIPSLVLDNEEECVLQILTSLVSLICTEDYDQPQDSARAKADEIISTHQVQTLLTSLKSSYKAPINKEQITTDCSAILASTEYSAKNSQNNAPAITAIIKLWAMDATEQLKKHWVDLVLQENHKLASIIVDFKLLAI